MEFSGIVMLVLFLAVFVLVPILFAQFGRHRPDGLANLQVCPGCGAHNYKSKERCYCCGHRFLFPQSDGADRVQVPRVKTVDDSGKRRGTGPPGLREVAFTTEGVDKTGRA